MKQIFKSKLMVATAKYILAQVEVYNGQKAKNQIKKN